MSDHGADEDSSQRGEHAVHPAAPRDRWNHDAFELTARGIESADEIDGNPLVSLWPYSNNSDDIDFKFTDPTPFPESSRLGLTDSFVYLEDEEGAEEVEDALNAVLQRFGMRIVFRGAPRRSSWFRRFTIMFRKVGESDTTSRLLRELDRAIELRAIDEIQARVDAAQGDVVAKLLSSLESSNSALIQIGSVLVVKVDGVPLVRNLTQAEIRLLQENPDLCADPKMVLHRLQIASTQPPRADLQERMAQHDRE